MTTLPPSPASPAADQPDPGVPRRRSAGPAALPEAEPDAELEAEPTLVVAAPPAPIIERPQPRFGVLATPPSTGRGRLRVLHTIPSALAALRANKGRSLLTTLGIIIGVAAVIAIVALGEGASANVSNQLQGLGVNILTIVPGSTQTFGARSGAGGIQTLKAADADAIASSVPAISNLSPVVGGSAQVVAGNQNWQTRIQAVRPPYQQLQDWHLAQGAFFSDEDDQAARNVAVLGQTVWSNLYPDGRIPLGQLIRIRNVPFTVVGILASKGTGFGGDQDDVVFVPFRTGQVRLFGATAINQIVLQVGDASQIDDVMQEVDGLLRQRHELRTTQADDFTIRNNNDVINRVEGVSQTMTILLAAVAAVSLIVGGIGIMNIMLVSVTERTREIGIRLAIGAQPADILWQFLVEAVVLSALGGVLGILVGLGVAAALPAIAGWTTAMPWNAVALAFGFSALIGVFFGIYPARKASRLDPIVALRYE